MEAEERMLEAGPMEHVVFVVHQNQTAMVMLSTYDTARFIPDCIDENDGFNLPGPPSRYRIRKQDPSTGQYRFLFGRSIATLRENDTCELVEYKPGQQQLEQQTQMALLAAPGVQVKLEPSVSLSSQYSKLQEHDEPPAQSTSSAQPSYTSRSSPPLDILPVQPEHSPLPQAAKKTPAQEASSDPHLPPPPESDPEYWQNNIDDISDDSENTMAKHPKPSPSTLQTQPVPAKVQPKRDVFDLDPTSDESEDSDTSDADLKALIFRGKVNQKDSPRRRQRQEHFISSADDDEDQLSGLPDLTQITDSYGKHQQSPASAATFSPRPLTSMYPHPPTTPRSSKSSLYTPSSTGASVTMSAPAKVTHSVVKVKRERSTTPTKRAQSLASASDFPTAKKSKHTPTKRTSHDDAVTFVEDIAEPTGRRLTRSERKSQGIPLKTQLDVYNDERRGQIDVEWRGQKYGFSASYTVGEVKDEVLKVWTKSDPDAVPPPTREDVHVLDAATPLEDESLLTYATEPSQLRIFYRCCHPAYVPAEEWRDVDIRSYPRGPLICTVQVNMAPPKNKAGHSDSIMAIWDRITDADATLTPSKYILFCDLGEDPPVSLWPDHPQLSPIFPHEKLKQHAKHFDDIAPTFYCHPMLTGKVAFVYRIKQRSFNKEFEDIPFNISVARFMVDYIKPLLQLQPANMKLEYHGESRGWVSLPAEEGMLFKLVPDGAIICLKNFLTRLPGQEDSLPPSLGGQLVTSASTTSQQRTRTPIPEEGRDASHSSDHNSAAVVEQALTRSCR